MQLSRNIRLVMTIWAILFLVLFCGNPKILWSKFLPGLQLCQVGFFLDPNKKSSIQETPNYLAYANGSTDSKWLKSVDRKKMWPIPWAIVRFKIPSSISISRFFFYFSSLEATFWVNFFSIHSQFFLAFNFFSLFYSRTKKLPQKFLNTLSILKK